MKYLRRFNENISVYDNRWEDLLPEEITIIKGSEGSHKFEKGNVMLNSDMIQITYDNTEWGIPDTLEIDIYFVNIDDGKSSDFTLDKKSGNLTTISSKDNLMRLNVDITYGDLMACEFSIDKINRVKLIQDTTYGSKFDPSNTIFAFNDNSLKDFIEFLNRFNHGVKLTIDDFKFLSN